MSVLPEREAIPGQALPPVPDSAYPDGAVDLPDVNAPPIPAAMVEAAARALPEMEDLAADTFDELSDREQEMCRVTARAMLEAALGVCEVHEEWQATLDEGQGYPCSGWWSMALRPDATETFKWAKNPLTQWERRWVYATPAEPVDTDGAGK